MNTLHFKLLRARHSSTRMFHLFMHMNFQLLHLVTRIFCLQLPHQWIIFWCLFHLSHLTSSKHGKFIEIPNSLSALDIDSVFLCLNALCINRCIPLGLHIIHSRCLFSEYWTTTQHAFNPTYTINTYFVLVFFYIP